MNYRQIDTAIINHCLLNKVTSVYDPTAVSIVAEKARTTHLVLACVLAPSTADAQRRRRLGSHRVDPFESRVGNVGPGLKELVLRAGDAGAAGEGVADRHDKIEMEG